MWMGTNKEFMFNIIKFHWYLWFSDGTQAEFRNNSTALLPKDGVGQLQMFTCPSSPASSIPSPTSSYVATTAVASTSPNSSESHIFTSKPTPPNPTHCFIPVSNSSGLSLGTYLASHSVKQAGHLSRWSFKHSLPSPPTQVCSRLSVVASSHSLL